MRNLHLRDVRVAGTPCGALVGLNEGTILSCSVTGRVSGSEEVGGLVGFNWNGNLVQCESEVRISGGDQVGGVVGLSWGGTLIRCQSQAEVSGRVDAGGLVGQLSESSIIESKAAGTVASEWYAGGLAGSIRGATILRCAADCQVTSDRQAGGLVGYTGYTRLLIIDSYARGSVAACVGGGLANGDRGGNILRSYAACSMIPLPCEEGPAQLGGLIGETSLFRPLGAIASFWDAELSGIDVGAGGTVPENNLVELGTGLTTEQMQQQAPFAEAGWDFGQTWAMSKDGYPVLQWEQTSDDDSPPEEKQP